MKTEDEKTNVKADTKKDAEEIKVNNNNTTKLQIHNLL
jgi:hypothetical protein